MIGRKICNFSQSCNMILLTRGKLLLKMFKVESELLGLPFKFWFVDYSLSLHVSFLDLMLNKSIDLKTALHNNLIFCSLWNNALSQEFCFRRALTSITSFPQSVFLSFETFAVLFFLSSAVHHFLLPTSILLLCMVAIGTRRLAQRKGGQKALWERGWKRAGIP